nr:MAG TPA: hypothetical protein [Caudoviricetes sp.]
MAKNTMRSCSLVEKSPVITGLTLKLEKWKI